MTTSYERAAHAPASQALVELAAESWRLEKTIARALPAMDPFDAERLANQYGWYQRKVHAVLDEAGLSVCDLTGRPYDVGMAVTPLNLDDLPLPPDAPYVIEQMVDPIVMQDGVVRKAGTVMLQVSWEDM